MLKKSICFFVLVCISLTSIVSAKSFSDVPSGSAYYQAISSLSDKGIITGYEDGTFNPGGHITRAEAAAVIVRAAELSTPSSKSTYSDISDNHWACPYIMSATKAGIINGMGDNKFSPNGKVTYNQILKMIVCMTGAETNAEKQGGWPTGYVQVAYSNYIIDKTTYNSIAYKNKGNDPATRQDVALFIYNAILSQEEDTIYVNSKKISIGMGIDTFGKPDEIITSTADFKWYVYGTDTYKNFFAAGVANNKIVAIASTGKGFNYMGFECGDVSSDSEKKACMYTDKNDNNILHSVLIIDDNYAFDYYKEGTFTDEQLSGESKMNFHFTNAFRVYHNLKPFIWSDKAAKSAQLHSKDMADNNYFSHTSLSGTSPSQRMQQQGINWSGWAENIAAGSTRYLGFHSFDGWVNSSGHRSNMLGKNSYLGVGIAYNKNSTYKYYHTQNFFR